MCSHNYVIIEGDKDLISIVFAISFVKLGQPLDANYDSVASTTTKAAQRLQLLDIIRQNIQFVKIVICIYVLCFGFLAAFMESDSFITKFSSVPIIRQELSCGDMFPADPYQYEKTDAFIRFLESITMWEAEINFGDMIRYVDNVLKPNLILICEF